jgi:hypothetical protein
MSIHLEFISECIYFQLSNTLWYFSTFINDYIWSFNYFKYSRTIKSCDTFHIYYAKTTDWRKFNMNVITSRWCTSYYCTSVWCYLQYEFICTINTNITNNSYSFSFCHLVTMWLFYFVFSLYFISTYLSKTTYSNF